MLQTIATLKFALWAKIDEKKIHTHERNSASASSQSTTTYCLSWYFILKGQFSFFNMRKLLFLPCYERDQGVNTFCAQSFIKQGLASKKAHSFASKHCKCEWESWCYDLISCRCWNWAHPNLALKWIPSIIFEFLLQNRQNNWSFTSHYAWRVLRSEEALACFQYSIISPVLLQLYHIFTIFTMFHNISQNNLRKYFVEYCSLSVTDSYEIAALQKLLFAASYARWRIPRIPSNPIATMLSAASLRQS